MKILQSFLTAVVMMLAGSALHAQQLTPAEFEKQAANLNEVQVVDVRTPDEFRKGHIKGALNYNINSKDFARQVKSLDKQKPVFVYCLAGPRSTKASDLLREQGYTVYELKGGMMAWNRAKKPVELVEPKSDGMTVSAFNTEVSKDKLVLVDFYAKWCGPCKKMAPDLKALDEQYGDRLTLVKIDADANGLIVNELNVEALPTLQLYKDGVKVWSHTGYLEKKDIEKKIKEQF